MKILDTTHPFYRPLWRRLLLVAAPFLWAFLEYANGNALWAYVFAGIGGFLGWHLVVAWREHDGNG